MKRTLALSTMATALILAILIPAIAQPKNGWMQRRRASFFVQHIINDLQLTAGQRSQIKAILQRERPAILAIIQKAEQANAQLRSQKSFDEAFVRSVAQQESANMADALVERERIRAEILAVLNPQQQLKFNQLASEFRTALDDRIANFGDQL